MSRIGWAGMEVAWTPFTRKVESVGEVLKE